MKNCMSCKHAALTKVWCDVKCMKSGLLVPWYIIECKDYEKRPDNEVMREAEVVEEV